MTITLGDVTDDLRVARQVKDSFRDVRDQLGIAPGEVAIGISLIPSGDKNHPIAIGVALRVRDESILPQALDRFRDLSTSAGVHANVQFVGRIGIAIGGEDTTWSTGNLRSRVRPLMPGLSIGHTNVSCGTIGAFVTVKGSRGLFLLSNNHVLADSDRASVNDWILQPGRTDLNHPEDQARVARLSRTVPLEAEGANMIDAALARLDNTTSNGLVNPVYPAGYLIDTADFARYIDDEVPVEKVGRTTGLTRGRVSAIELDDLAVEYPVGVCSFDNQIEVSGTGGTNFSAGGDSGAIIYSSPDRIPIGLLFAGSERGGDYNTGLTFANPIDIVLDSFGASLVSEDGS